MNMQTDQHDDAHEDAFESDLSRGLTMLADGAPAGPSPQQVLGALNKRDTSHRRPTLALAAGLALLAGAAVMILAMNSADQPTSDRIAIAHRQASLLRFTTTTSTVQAASANPIAVSQPPIHLATDSLHSFSAALSIAEPVASRSLIAPISTEASHMDWNLTLSLTLASAAADDAMPVIQFSSPW